METGLAKLPWKNELKRRKNTEHTLMCIESRGGQIDTNIDNIDTNVGIGIDRYQRENIDT